MHRWLVDFKDGSRDMRVLLGGKGANIAEMTRGLGPDRVPAGFTITTEACVAYMRDGRFPDGLMDQVREAIGRLEAHAGKRFGDPADPLLVSVRSGARDSMPGMMDTVLNLDGQEVVTDQDLPCILDLFDLFGGERLRQGRLNKLFDQLVFFCHCMPLTAPSAQTFQTLIV